MKKYIITAFIILFSFPVFSQQWSLGGRIGYGSYFMGTLKDFQELRLQSSTLPLLTTDNYPISPFYRIEVAINELKFVDKIGLFYTFNSTGSRSTLSDYSGRIDLDAIINGHQLGLIFQKNLSSDTKVTYAFYTDVAFIMSGLKTKDFLKIVSPTKITQKEEYRFNSKGFSIEPGVNINYKLYPFDFQLNLGLLIDVSGKLYLDGKKDSWLVVDNVSTKPQWSGLRLGFQVSYCFGKRQQIKT